MLRISNLSPVRWPCSASCLSDAGLFRVLIGDRTDTADSNLISCTDGREVRIGYVGGRLTAMAGY